MDAPTVPFGLPLTVRAILQPDKMSARLRLAQIPMPVPTGPDDVLVKVHATSPCAGEIWWARDYPSTVPDGKIPVVGQDLSGQVVAAPEKSSFKAGDEVYGRIPASRPGCACDYTVAKASELALKPQVLNFLEAAATPLSALTAWQALFVHGSLDVRALKGNPEALKRNAGVKVLITGATGGVGSFTLQLASLSGAGAVVALCGPGREAAVKKLGATEAINYRETSIAAWAEADPALACHLVIDCVGGETLVGCWSAVKADGILLSITGDPNGAKPASMSKALAKSTWFLVEPLGSNLAEITELIDAGKLQPTIDSVWEFDEFEKAYERLDGGHSKGKIIIKVDG